MFRFLSALFVALLAFPAGAAEIYTPITTHSLAATGTSQAITTNFQAQSRVMRIHAVENIFFAIAASGAPLLATSATGTFLPKDTTEYFRVTPGVGIAVIRDTVTGQVYITELGK